MAKQPSKTSGGKPSNPKISSHMSNACKGGHFKAKCSTGKTGGKSC